VRITAGSIYPLGGEVEIDLGNRISLGFSAEYRLMLAGTITGIGMPMADGENITTSPMNISPQNGLYLEMPFRFPMGQGQRFSGELKPWFEYRPSGMSSSYTYDFTVGGESMTETITEPSSTSWSIGVIASLMFNY